MHQDKAKPEVQKQVFCPLLSLLSSKNTGLKAKATYKVENIWCISCVSTGAGYHKEKIG